MANDNLNVFDNNDTIICPNCGDHLLIESVVESSALIQCPSCDTVFPRSEQHQDRESVINENGMNESSTMDDELDETTENHELTEYSDMGPVDGEDEPENTIKHRVRSPRIWSKNIVAMIIGFCGGYFLHVAVSVPLVLLIFPEAGLPTDVEFLFNLFIMFISGAITGCLVTRLGWLYGMLAQFGVVIITLAIIVPGLYASVKYLEIGYLREMIELVEMRYLLYDLSAAALGGAIANRFRTDVWAFLVKLFGLIASGIGCGLQGISVLLYFYFLYLAGKAFFEEGAFLKALLYATILGPLVSAAFGFILFGIITAISWLFEKLYAWYAEDLELEYPEF